MREALETQVAASLDATPEMLPFLAELLADCWELGGDTGTIVDLLRPLQLSEHARLLDLGCGKGAVAVACAVELGCRVHGIDGFEPFIAEAIDRAASAGVSDRCTLECCDLRESVGTARDYDVVVFSSVGPLIDGRPCIESLRACVRPGGHILIDDGFLSENAASIPPAYSVYVPYVETRDCLTAAGDVIIREVLSPLDERGAIDDDTTELIRARAAGIALRQPQAKELLDAYVRNQELECERLRRFHVPATWLLRRAGD